MRWTPGGSGSDIEDRRGSSGGGGFRLGGGMGIGGMVVLLLLSLVFHKNFFALLGGGGTPAQQSAPGQPVEQTPAEKQAVDFVTFVLNDAQTTWDSQLAAQTGVQYQHAKLVLFRDSIDSGCGYAQAATGPFYCPEDRKVYIDLGFYDELRNRFGAPGDFAQAYVITHEIGHHVQKLLGIEEKVRQAMESDPQRKNDLSVRLELQADCFAGVWGHSTAERKILEDGDVDEGLHAAAAIGDDRLQKMSGRAVNPDSFTHGSSQQRVEWFRRGFSSGKVADCDTFNAR